MDLEKFRLDYPEFGNTTRYPNRQVVKWSTLGETLISADRLGDDVRAIAVELFTAHNLVLAANSARTAAAGGIPGSGVSGQATSKSVGDVSVSYETTSAMEDDAGHWNATTYGREYIDLVRGFGAGCVQL